MNTPQSHWRDAFRLHYCDLHPATTAEPEELAHWTDHQADLHAMLARVLEDCKAVAEQGIQSRVPRTKRELMERLGMPAAPPTRLWAQCMLVASLVTECLTITTEAQFAGMSARVRARRSGTSLPE